MILMIDNHHRRPIKSNSRQTI